MSGNLATIKTAHISDLYASSGVQQMIQARNEDM